jgi:hypothetical protein
MGIFNLFRWRKAPQPDRVSITDEAVTRVRPDGIEEKIRWDALCEVGILTTDEGPMQEDVFFLLIASDGKSGCVVPQGAEGCDHLVERLQKLPGFDNEAVIKAMGSTSDAKFICWKRPVS